MEQKKDYGVDLQKMREYMNENSIQEIELSGVNASIHQERICNGYERSIDRTGYITLVYLNHGDLSLWDYEDNEEIQLEEVTYGLDEVIDAFWSRIEMNNNL